MANTTTLYDELEKILCYVSLGYLWKEEEVTYDCLDDGMFSVSLGTFAVG